jgi:signal transduction histidine kinase
MKFPHFAFSLHGLRAQVLLWTALPLTILLIIFAFSGVSSHQTSMRTLAVEENTRLVEAFARLISAELENYAWENGLAISAVQAEDLDLASLLTLEHSHASSLVLLLDSKGEIIFRQGALASAPELANNNTLNQILETESGILLNPNPEDGTILAYAAVEGTGWTLLIRESWHSLTDPLIRFEQVVPFILFTAGAISLLTLFFGLRYVVQPLRELGLRANRIAQGQFDAVSKAVGGVKEIEDLRITLNETALQLQNHQEALRDYLHAITQAQEEERARLGRELHDETVQTLIALGHKAQMVQRNFERSAPQTSEQISDLRKMIAEAIDELRRFSQALHPHYLEELGLVTALEILAREFGAEFTSSELNYILNKEQELAIYRIAQEALNNARRHARTTKIRVALQMNQKQLRLKVEDAGIGFHPPARLKDLTHTGHFGLMGMRERAQLVAGQLSIHSADGKGTSVELTLDLEG